MKQKTNGSVLAAGFIGMTFFGLAFVVMGAVLPSLITRFSLDNAVASTIAGLLPVGILVGSLMFGPIVDRYGYKLLIVCSSVVTAIGLEMLAFSSEVSLIRLSIFLIGLGGGSLNGLTNALISDASNDHSRASNLSILGIFYALGAITVPLIYAPLSKSVPYTTIVSFAGALVALSVLYFLFVKFPEEKQKQGVPFGKLLTLAKEPVMLLLSFVLFFQSGLEGILNSWISTYINTVKGLDTEFALYALGFISVGILTSRILTSYLLKVFPKLTILTISMLITSLGMGLIVLADSKFSAIAGTFTMGLGYASTFPIVLGTIGDKFKEISGTAFSFALVIGLTGNTLLNLLVGIVPMAAFPVIVLVSAFMVILLFSVNDFRSRKA
ncbi:Facilitator Superfamily Protein [Bacteroidales bacterium CF]|jgi:Fucose permease|nr:Facilitator Superfamily Protein [Bacteroidales bacterium CF]